MRIAGMRISGMGTLHRIGEAPDLRAHRLVCGVRQLACGTLRTAGSALRRASLLAILLAAIAALSLLASTPARARELRIRNFQSEIDVLPDSSLEVTETIRVEFIGSWQGLYRTIPVEYPGPGGFNYSLVLENISATDEGGADAPSLRIEKRRQGASLALKIYVPGADTVTRTIALHYRVRNGLRYFEDHDELYWNITGTEWDVPIEAASAHVTLPPGITGLHAADFSGAFGSRAQEAQVEVLGSNVDVRTVRPLAFHQGLTLVAGWDKGFVHVPDSSEKVAQFLESNWPLFAPVLAFLVMLWLWYTRGRDPQVGAIAVQYEPPDGLTPGEVGTLIDSRATMRDITATLVDLAVHGYLTIEERTKSHLLGLYSDKEYVFHASKNNSELGGLKPHELIFFSGLFDSGTANEVTLSELQNKFYKNLPGIRNAIFDSLVERGYYLHRPDRVRQTFLAGGLIVGALLYGAGVYAAQTLGMQALPFSLGAIVTAGIIIAFGWFMSARTAAGARALHNALGFEDFLGHVEADRLERVSQTPATFEKYLPFAMALGVEKKWVGAFEGIFTQPPTWYIGSPGSTFHPTAFGNSLDAMSTRAGQVMSSAPRSAGSSGFGGGGSSGGGFGGGGGGGF